MGLARNNSVSVWLSQLTWSWFQAEKHASVLPVICTVTKSLKSLFLEGGGSIRREKRRGHRNHTYRSTGMETRVHRSFIARTQP